MATQHTHGRGGAGNINYKAADALDEGTLVTPTIKQQNYTTGRGGSANIVTNDSAENARKAQDVDLPKYHDKEKKGTYHWGRGGEGNMTTIGESGRDMEEKERQRRKSSRNNGERSSSFIEKSKEKLGLGGGKAAEGSAIED